MARVRRLRKFSSPLSTYMVVTVDEKGKILAASVITKEPNEEFNEFIKTVVEESERQKKRYPKRRTARRQVTNLKEFRALHPWIFIPKRS